MANNTKVRGKFDFGGENRHSRRYNGNGQSYQTYDNVTIDLSVGGKSYKTLYGQNAVFKGTILQRKGRETISIPVSIATTETLMTIYKVTKSGHYPLTSAGVTNKKYFDFKSLFKICAREVQGELCMSK